MGTDFSPLFEPLLIGRGVKKLTLKNRMVMAPMVTCLANSQGFVTPRMVDYYVERAKGGIAAIVVEAMDIDDRMLFNRLGVFHDRFINELENLATSIKERGAAAIAQINQTGIRGNTPGPDDLSADQMEELIVWFSQAAERVKKAEFDGVMIHGAHGYLISSFLSPLTNHRKDAYGGDRKARTHFAADVVRSVRRTVGDDFPIFFRMNGEDFLPGGFTVEDARVAAPILEAAGADVISIGGGVGILAHDLSLGDNKSYGQMIMPMYIPRGCRVEIAAEIKKGLNIPVSVAGRINDPFLARDIIAQKKVDLVDLGRQMIADPYFPQKIEQGQIQDIGSCIACNYCHGKRMRAMKQVRCAINPWAGREAELREIKPAATSQKVMVVGGGIAGLQAAQWLGKRGHRVFLYEKSDRLGGQIRLAAMPPHKEEIRQFLELSIRQIKKLKVKIHLNSEVTPERLIQEHPQAVILATGGRPLRPPNIPLHDKMKCIYAWDVLSGKEKFLGEKTVVLGGGFVGAEVADFIRSTGIAKEVEIVEMREAMALDLEPAFRQLLIERLQSLGVKMLSHFRVREVTARQVIGEDVRTKDTKKIDADAVVIALGTESVEFPLEAVQKKGIRFFLIGDAHTPRGIAEAVRDGYLAGISV
ncbi:MAG TPA: FAD-dependent oxidoreductase [Thermodesulfobacteriota bacterium]|nr:FAD-dependent oxidoreductase [Thermodesulfobacteriota bacterium]